MIPFNRLLAASVVASALGGLSGLAQAVPSLQHFSFFGTCADCTLNSAPGEPIATLALRADYVPGTALSIDDLVEFSYVGSNLVDPYTVDRNGVDGPQYGYEMDGVMDSSVGAKNFRISFGDGLRFESTSAGSWFTCAPKGETYYSGTCDYLNNNDFGRSGATWNAPGGNTVPEPATLVLVGLAAVGLIRRRTAC